MDNRRFSREAAARRRELEKIPLRADRAIQSATAPRPIRIGRNAWIGFDVCVMPGVTVGEGAIVGARSVVTNDVEPFAVVAGNPARLIRRLDREATHGE